MITLRKPNWTILGISVLSLFSLVDAIGQDQGFCEGWDAGYKQGWCFGFGNGCMDPMVPICPMPGLNESNFQAGYNKGFTGGQAARGGNGSGNSSPSQGQVRYGNYNTGTVPTVNVQSSLPVIPQYTSPPAPSTSKPGGGSEHRANGVRWIVGNSTQGFDQEYFPIEDAGWSIERISEGSAVFIYDEDVMSTLFQIEDLTFITSTTQRMRDDRDRVPPVLVVNLPFTIGKGAYVRLVCKPNEYISVTRTL